MSGATGETPWARRATLVTFVVLAGSLSLMMGDPALVGGIVREGGLVETLSAVLWGLSGLACLACGLRSRDQRALWLLGGVLLLALAARELDFQKRFTDWNLANRSNYLDPEIPLRERAAVLLMVVLPLGIAGLAFLARMWEPFRTAWREGRPWSRDVLLWLVMLFLASRLDKLHHLLPDLEDHPWFKLRTVAEESLELCLALFVALTLLPAWRAALGRGGRAPQ